MHFKPKLFKARLFYLERLLGTWCTLIIKYELVMIEHLIVRTLYLLLLLKKKKTASVL